MSPRASRKGFTLIEVLVTTGLIAISATLIVPFIGAFQQTQTVETLKQDVIQSLRRAQNKAVNGERGMSWGVYFHEGTFTTYAIASASPSMSYADHVAQYDETRSLPPGYTFSGLLDVPFLTVTGVPTVSGTIYITHTTGVWREIIIDGSGLVTGGTVSSGASAPTGSSGSAASGAGGSAGSAASGAGGSAGSAASGAGGSAASGAGGSAGSSTSGNASQADLIITKTGPSSATDSEVIVYTVTVTNQGLATASAPVITDLLPAGFIFVDNQSSGSCSAIGGSVSCTLTNLAPGVETSVQIAVTVTGACQCSTSNSATVSTSTPESNYLNNMSAVVPVAIACNVGGNAGSGTPTLGCVATADPDLCYTEPLQLGANLIANGDFEEPDIQNIGPAYNCAPAEAPFAQCVLQDAPSWAPAAYQVELQSGMVSSQGTAYSGIQWAEVDAQGSVYLTQNFPTSPDKLYSVHYWYAPRPGFGQQEMGVYFNGQLMSVASGDGGSTWTPGLSWSSHSFTAWGGQGSISTLGFGCITCDPVGAGNLIDLVSVQEIVGCQCTAFGSSSSSSSSSSSASGMCSANVSQLQARLTQCADEQDNDGDSLVDSNDPGCTSLADDNEGDSSSSSSSVAESSSAISSESATSSSEAAVSSVSEELSSSSEAVSSVSIDASSSSEAAVSSVSEELSSSSEAASANASAESIDLPTPVPIPLN